MTAERQTGIPFAVFALRCCHNRPPCRLVLLHTWESSLYFPTLEPAIPAGALSTLSLVPTTVWCTIYRHCFLLFNSVHRRFSLKTLTSGPLKTACSQFSFQPPSSFPHTWRRKQIRLRKCVLIISRRWIDSKKCCFESLLYVICQFLPGQEPGAAGERAYSVGDAARGGYVLCFAGQSAAAIAVRVTRS
jgi:hypothetical protein